MLSQHKLKTVFERKAKNRWGNYVTLCVEQRNHKYIRDWKERHAASINGSIATKIYCTLIAKTKSRRIIANCSFLAPHILFSMRRNNFHSATNFPWKRDLANTTDLGRFVTDVTRHLVIRKLRLCLKTGNEWNHNYKFNNHYYQMTGRRMIIIGHEKTRREGT